MSKLFPEDQVTSWDDEPPNIHIIGNLPFNVSTPLIFRWIRDISLQQGAWCYGRVPLTLTFQREVGERMVAQILDAQRSRMSIITQFYCDVSLLYLIRGDCFVPKPKVDVAVVKFVPRIQPIMDVPYDYMNKLVRHIFHYRQKYVHKGAW